MNRVIEEFGYTGSICKTPPRREMALYMDDMYANLREILIFLENVEVVRCKDCKYNTSARKCLHPSSIIDIPKDDDFCSYGEHRCGNNTLNFNMREFTAEESRRYEEAMKEVYKYTGINIYDLMEKKNEK